MPLDASRVSVVLAVRDGERYVAESMESILGQTTPPGEVVVVDDGSTDSTATILEGYRDAITVIHQRPRNQWSATNRGIAATRGRFLAFLDADDTWTPNSIAVRLQRIEADDRPDGVFGHIEQFVSPELGEHASARFRFDPMPPPTPLLQALLVRRSTIDRVGQFDETLSSAANIDWMSRALSLDVHLAVVPEVVSRRRLHGANMGAVQRDATNANLLKVVRAHHERRTPPATSSDNKA